jgi:hypothetical protein
LGHLWCVETNCDYVVHYEACNDIT